MLNIRQTPPPFGQTNPWVFWTGAGAMTVAFMVLETLSHAHLNHGATHGPLFRIEWFSQLTAWQAINAASYLLYLAPFVTPSIRLAEGPRRRLFAGFSLQLVFGAILIALTSWRHGPADILPCFHIANAFFILYAILRFDGWHWALPGLSVFALIVASAVFSQQHGWIDVGIGSAAGFMAFRVAFGRSLNFLDEPYPWERIQHHLQNLGNLLIKNRTATWEEGYQKGRWSFLRSPQQRPRHYAISGVLRDRFPKGAYVLDVGCGYGDLYRLMAGPGTRYTGIDIAASVVAQSRSEWSQDPHCRFEQAAFEHFDSPDRFDAVVLNEVLYYFPMKDLPNVLRKAQSLLSGPDGLIIVSMNDNWKAPWIWRSVQKLLQLEQAIVVQNPLTGSHWTVKTFRQRGERERTPQQKPTLSSRLTTRAYDLNIRFNMEAGFLRRRDPWKYEVSQYEKDRLAAMTEALERRTFQNGLEIGTGEGLFSSALAEQCRRLTCLDISRTALRRTRQRLKRSNRLTNVQLVHGTMRGWNPGDSRFDLIVFGDVLYYLEAPRKLGLLLPNHAADDVPRQIAKFSKWLVPGGTLLLCHGFGSEVEKDRLLRYRMYFEDQGLRLIHETKGTPSDKGLTRYLLSTLRRPEE